MAATITKTGKELKKSGIMIYTVIWQCSNLQIKLPPCSNPLIRNSLGGTPSLNQLSLAQTGNRVAVECIEVNCSAGILFLLGALIPLLFIVFKLSNMLLHIKVIYSKIYYVLIIK